MDFRFDIRHIPGDSPNAIPLKFSEK